MIFDAISSPWTHVRMKFNEISYLFAVLVINLFYSDCRKDEVVDQEIFSKPLHAIAVTAFWPVASKVGDTSNATIKGFKQYFNTSLQINCPYVFLYGRHGDNDWLSEIRNESYPTLWLFHKLSHLRMFGRTDDLNAIWLGKIDLSVVSFSTSGSRLVCLD